MTETLTRLPHESPPPPGVDERDWRIVSLLAENMRLREVGTDLCLRAIHVGTKYDGIHRLLDAAAHWAHALATDHGRPDATPLLRKGLCEVCHMVTLTYDVPSGLAVERKE